MFAANDNRAPEAHRALVEAQAITQPRGNVRPHRGNRWPHAERLANDVGGKEMIQATLNWRDFTARPQVCIANDNYEDIDDSGADQVREPVAYDNRLLHDTANRTVALHAAGKEWRPDDERFTQPHRNDPGRSVPVGMFTFNGAAYYQQDADAESETNRKADETAARMRLGPVCSRLLDLAGGDSTRAEIAAAVKQEDGPPVDVWTDWAVISWMRDPAYPDYAKAA
ncbi:hypothetical protein ABIA99_004266 [Bradyrhizobium sp. LB12.1]|uniref:hypothetical protein n=1 Tax=Bradyrhizobium sp. LB12.1 TaxID=3156327 RepID=UPI003395DE38